MLNLKSDDIESHHQVKDFMLEKDEIPLLKLDDSLTFEDVLTSIEDWNLGFTVVTGADGKMEGIITNADVRRGLLKHTHDFNKVEVSEIINRSPVHINQNRTVQELLRLIKSQSFPILYLPVINDAREPVGTLKFHNLIKGES